MDGTAAIFSSINLHLDAINDEYMYRHKSLNYIVFFFSEKVHKWYR